MVGFDHSKWKGEVCWCMSMFSTATSTRTTGNANPMHVCVLFAFCHSPSFPSSASPLFLCSRPYSSSFCSHPSSLSHLPVASTLLTASGVLMTVLLLLNVPLHLFLHISSPPSLLIPSCSFLSPLLLHLSSSAFFIYFALFFHILSSSPSSSNVYT